MDNGYKSAREYHDIFEDIIQNALDTFCKEHNMLCVQTAIVASYNTDTKYATVYFPSDMDTESNPYLNLTKEDLIVGQKVYIYHKYGDIEQGWISVK